jgi:hypothetical protein
MTACGHRVRFVATRREEFFEVPNRFFLIVSVVGRERAGRGGIHFVAGLKAKHFGRQVESASGTTWERAF